MRVLWIAKRRLVGFFLPALLLLSSTLYVHNVTHKLTDKVIVLDAGHGGIDSGANRKGVLEKDINLTITLELRDILHQYGAKVILARQKDVDLSSECDNEKVRGRYHRDLAARVEMVEESDADLFISIHANAVANDKKHGAEVFSSPESDDSKALANIIQTELCKVTGVTRTAKTADYFVLRRNKIPAVLVEVGFITNPEERSALQNPEYQKKLAEAIALGILNYY